MSALSLLVPILTIPRRQRAAVTVALGLSAGAVGWSGLAQAAGEETASQVLLLPEHYELMENGVVVFKLETGENLSLTPEQYLILDDGLVLITDELAQASVYSLPVMGAVRSQLLSDLEQVATIDGTVAEATPAQTLSITEGHALRLSEQVELQSYELAQTSECEDVSDDEGCALILGASSEASESGGLAVGMSVAPGAMALLGMLMTSDQPEPELENSAPFFTDASGSLDPVYAPSPAPGSIFYAYDPDGIAGYQNAVFPMTDGGGKLGRDVISFSVVSASSNDLANDDPDTNYEDYVQFFSGPLMSRSFIGGDWGGTFGVLYFLVQADLVEMSNAGWLTERLGDTWEVTIRIEDQYGGSDTLDLVWQM